MKNTTFILTKNLVVPATGNPSKGYLLFPAGLFGLSYNTLPKPRQSQINITLTVVDLTTEEDVWILGTYEITENGFPVVANQVEYDSYLEVKSALEAIVNEKQEIANNLYAQYLEDPSYLESYNAAEADLEASRVELYALPVVNLEYESTNKYSDVIDYFKGDGTLTDEGVLWAKQVKFLGESLGDYIM